MAAAKTVLHGLVIGLLSACVTGAPKANFGVQEGHVSYVPARIALQHCQSWPEAARFASLPLSTAKAPEVKSLCAAIDQYVLAGFQGQPYMKGYSPDYTAEHLAEKAGANADGSGLQLWAQRPSDCHDCRNAAAFYSASIASRPEWLAWLNSLSMAVNHADAMLLPLVTYAYERRFDDRGLDVAEKAAGVVLLLIDTNNGQLIWAGGRDGSAQTKRLRNGNVPAPVAMPGWLEVQERLLVEDLWRDFPGRQVF